MPSHSPAAASSPSTMQRHHHGLQGPRPATLKVITKQSDHLGRKKRRPVQQQPVIIYVESPKVVHAQPSEFKSVVQRLTGAPPASMLFSSSASSPLPPPPLQFPLQLYGQLPLVASSLRSSSVAAAPAPAASCLPAADAAASIVRSLGLFTGEDQLISPAAFLYDHQICQSMVAAAGAAVQAANPPLLAPSSLGACYQGNLFVNQQ